MDEESIPVDSPLRRVRSLGRLRVLRGLSDRVGGGGRLARAAVVGGLGTALTVLPTVALWKVRRMRQEARRHEPLALDIDLDGIEPVRTVVVLGDSASAGFRLDIPEQAAGRRVARALNLRDGRATRLSCVARNGATSADVLAEQVEAAAEADVVLIGVGANDAKDRIPSDIIEASLRGLIERVRELAAPDARIVIVGCPDLSVAPGLPWVLRVLMRPNVRRVTRIQQRVAADLGVPLVPLPRDELGPDMFAADGFHPGPLGHERVSAKVLAHL
jgi:lysophospholipase L1-like esterase